MPTKQALIGLVGDCLDARGRPAQGWLFFDAECDFCTRSVRWCAPVLEKRGIVFLPLQDPRVAAVWGLGREELLRELRFLLPDGTESHGAGAVLAAAARVWWARPLVWLGSLPGMKNLLEGGYRWVVLRRNCADSHRARGARDPSLGNRD